MKLLQATCLAAFSATAVYGTTAEGGSDILVQENARQMNQSLLWGAYRPNLYFGVRPRIAKSFMGALMWAKVDNYQDVQHSKCSSHVRKARSRYAWRTGSVTSYLLFRTVRNEV